VAYDYSTWLEALRLVMETPSPSTDFDAYIPTIINQAEQTIYRELNLLATIIKDSSASTTVNQREFTLPTASGTFVVLESMNVLNGSERAPLTKYSREAMDMLFPSSASTGGQAPTAYAPFTDQVYLLGPVPGAVFSIECIGTVRPNPLSPTNTTTFLSSQLPDLFFAGTVQAACAYKQNWSAEGDDPKMAVSWRESFGPRLASATGEETRRKYQAFASLGA
jgi:hypothetical protein